MNIFKLVDGKPVSVTLEEMNGFKEILKRDFPASFRENEPLPIKVDFQDKYRYPVDLFTPNRKQQPSTRRIHTPQPLSVSCKTTVKTADGTTEYFCSRTFPKWEEKGKRYRVDSVIIKGNTTYDPKNDLALLCYLYCLSDAFGNNVRAGAGKVISYLQFIQPDKIAKQQMESMNNDYSIHNLIINESSRVSYEVMKKTANHIGLPTSDLEDGDRVMVAKKLKENQNLYESFKRVLPQFQELGKTSYDLSHIGDKVREAIKPGVGILKEVANQWVLQTINGENKRELVQVVGTKKEEKIMALVEYLKSDPDTVKLLTDLLVEVPA